MADEFEPAPAASECVSLRARCQQLGLNEAETKAALTHAHNIISFVKRIDIRRFNPQAPMSGINSG